MKKLTLSLILLTIAGFLFAQQTITYNDFVEKEKKNDNEIQTVMSSFEVNRISGFGGPTVTFTNINGEFAVLSGGGGGVIINNVFLGGYGEGASSYIKTSTGSLEFGHGGFWLGYEFGPQRMIHPVLSARLGWGEVKGINIQNRGLKDGFFAVVPTLSAEINFTQFFKMNIGAEYRQTFGINNMDGLKDKDFSSPGVFMSFIFGWF